MYPKPIHGLGLCECGCGSRATKRFARGHSAHNGPAEFWRRIPDHLPSDACWPWPGPFHRYGYGAWGGAKVHRLMADDCGPVVRHSCDNPPCCNPAHLVAGSQADNVADMVARDRESRPAAKISPTQAEEIRTTYARGGVTQRSLAGTYGLAQSQISRIVNRRRWKKVV
jgi:hypothetical protein